MAEGKRVVLIAMDGSKHSIYALEWYLNSLYRMNDEVVLTYCAEFGVTMTPTTLTAWSPSSLESMVEHHEHDVKVVMDIIEQYVNKHNLKHTLERAVGPAGEAIVKAAEKHKADLIICGSRGHGAFRRTFMGSVSDYVVHHSHVPVLICKHGDEINRLKTGKK